MQPDYPKYSAHEVSDGATNGILTQAMALWQATARDVEKQAISVLRELGGCTAHSVTVHTGEDDELFMLSPGVDQQRRQPPPILSRLNERHLDVLQALAELNATSFRDRRTASEIAKMCFGESNSSLVKNPLAELLAMGLVDSERGRAGGSWLSSANYRMIFSGSSPPQEISGNSCTVPISGTTA
jgi:hypothetical protein